MENKNIETVAAPVGTIRKFVSQQYLSDYKTSTLDSAYAAKSHGTHVSYSTTTPLANGTASAGSSANVSRGDHVHPLQTSVSGNAGTATKLATARTITLSGGVSGSVSFDGSGNVTLSTTLANFDASKIATGTVATARLPVSSTSATGIVQLNNSTTSTSTTQAATANAVKLAYDKAQQAFQSGNDVKKKLVDTLIAKNMKVSTSDSWEKLIENISKLVNTAPSYGSVGEWATITEGMQEKRFDYATGIIDDKLYITGGTTSSSATTQTECYDLNTGMWSYKAALPASVWNNRGEVVGGKLWSLGGNTSTLSAISPTNNVHMYDPITNTWTSKQKLWYPVHLCKSTKINKTIYIQGEYDFGSHKFITYDTSTSTSSAMFGSINYFYKAPTVMVAIGNDIYMSQGATAGSTTKMYKLNVNSQSVTTLGTNLPTSDMCAYGASFAVDDIIYAIGGQSSANSGTMESASQKTLYSYNPVTNKWSTIGDAINTRTRMGYQYYDNKLFLIGGHTGASRILQDIEVLKLK